MKISYFVAPSIKIKREVRSSMIIDRVCHAYGIDHEDLQASTRKSHIAFARQLTMYMLRKKTNLSLGSIGNLFNRDHTTVIHSIRTIENYIETNSLGKREEINELFNSC